MLALLVGALAAPGDHGLAPSASLPDHVARVGTAGFAARWFEKGSGRYAAGLDLGVRLGPVQVQGIVPFDPGERWTVPGTASVSWTLPLEGSVQVAVFGGSWWTPEKVDYAPGLSLDARFTRGTPEPGELFAGFHLALAPAVFGHAFDPGWRDVRLGEPARHASARFDPRAVSAGFTVGLAERCRLRIAFPDGLSGLCATRHAYVEVGGLSIYHMAGFGWARVGARIPRGRREP